MLTAWTVPDGEGVLPRLLTLFAGNAVDVHSSNML
jgi:hypothetical protein